MSREKTAPRSGLDRAWMGFAAVCIGNVIVLGIGSLLAAGVIRFSNISEGGWDEVLLGLTLIAAVSAVQMIHVIPVAIWARKKPHFLKGVAIAALLTFVLNLACAPFIHWT